MCPDDPTPLGDAMTHRFPEQKIPQPRPEAKDGETHEAGKGEADIRNRPPLPDHVKPMAADREDIDPDQERRG